MSQPQLIAPGVHKVGLLFVNAYFVSNATNSQEWVLIDTGMPNMIGKITEAARAVFGEQAPQAIVLTHGHVDHAGSAQSLAEQWQVPILASKRELPFLAGESNYPPKDPTVGGYMGMVCRTLPDTSMDFRPHLQELKELPSALEGWQVIPTPGHTPGHVSFFRASDKVLIAGDAIATVDMQSWIKAPLWVREIARPPAPFTPDWDATCESVGTLADLEPSVIAAGHGQVMSGTEALAQLRNLAKDFPLPPPEGGRYAYEAPTYDDGGALLTVPPAPPDRRAQTLIVAGLGLLAYSGWRATRR